MEISIIITFYQNINMLKNCICALSHTLSDRSDIEVLIVNDNPSTQLQPQLHDLDYPFPLRVIEMQENRGHSGACNTGAEMSSGDRLIFIDSDIIVTNSWLNELEKTYLAHTDCGAVASAIYDFSTDQVVYFGMELYQSESVKPLQGGMRQHPFLLRDQAVQIATTGCMMIKRSLFYKVGGLDEVFYNSCNDLDLSMKLNSIGRTNYISANSIVYHRGNGSGTIRFASHISARSLFFQKWGNEIKSNEHALSTLQKLYAEQAGPCGTYLVIDFSSSIFSDRYLDCLYQAKDISAVDRYRIRCQSENIIITDHLLWDICQMNLPILYFVDDYRRIMGNRLWFRLRQNPNDMIADRNGNIALPLR